ncbi:conserved hypothetical protein [Pyrobaculum neutrophilum V24Sta]|uniref:Uncharacterized protein n=1 Tax=Pyrobaculum neutrophilum (strain DSM 2338 / JCM 9278 / NBRC 100436 / V24Sta) TaxID=444157 RepID=B1YB55_PYRNV|nr:conserved hypothetical protein [Pyrobaculum neutrophilum V24Sta]
MVVNVSEVPIHKISGLALLRIRNPYAAVVYGSLADRSVNPVGSISAALNRLVWMPKFGPPYAVVSSDVAVEKVEIEKPWLLLTAWRLGLDGGVTSVEGGKSVVEHRIYMRNPLAKVTIVVPKPARSESVFATVKNATGEAAEVLKYLGLMYARITFGEYGGRKYVIDVDPVPELENREEARQVAELL